MRRLNFLPGNWQYQGFFFLVILVVVTADQLTKLWVRHDLAVGQSRPEEGILRLTHVTNEGIIFGLHAPQILSLIIPIVVVIVALFLYYYYIYRYELSDGLLMKTGCGLVVGGSIGNLVDRFRLSHVTDFIDLRLWGDFHWPAFNLADSALVVGVILIIYFMLRSKVFQSTNFSKDR